MEQALIIMLPPLVACLILTGIHTYLGLHVVSRGVIFVDLALAQVAALGSTFAFLLGYDPQSLTGYFYSLGFAFFAAAIFSLSRLKDKRIPQEAIIGIVFAVASSAAILIADRAPQGAEHVEAMLTGSILWVSWPTILKTLLIYSVVSIFHFIFREKFLLISMQPEEAERRGLAVRWWDFLFYMSFGFVITSSVAIAGVLLVFCFLIIPSVIGMLFSVRIGTRLAIGWVSGILVSLGGLWLSYGFDFPSGPAIVCTFGIFLVLAAVYRYLSQAHWKAPALLRVAGISAALTGALFLCVHFRPSPVAVEAKNETEIETLDRALSDLRSPGGAHSEAAEVLLAKRDLLLKRIQNAEVQVDGDTVQAIGRLGDARLTPVLDEAFQVSKDSWVRLYACEGMIQLGEKDGLHKLIHMLKEDGDAPVFLKNRILERLRGLMGETFGYDPALSTQENEEAINRIEVWWHQNADRLKWDEDARTFG